MPEMEWRERGLKKQTKCIIPLALMAILAPGSDNWPSAQPPTTYQFQARSENLINQNINFKQDPRIPLSWQSFFMVPLWAPLKIVTAQPQPQPNSTSTRVGVDKVISWTTHHNPPHHLNF
jgi:hypothetical protein